MIVTSDLARWLDAGLAARGHVAESLRDDRQVTLKTTATAAGRP